MHLIQALDLLTSHFFAGIIQFIHHPLEVFDVADTMPLDGGRYRRTLSVLGITRPELVWNQTAAMMDLIRR